MEGRGLNFSIDESNNLIDIITKYKDIIENTKTNGIALGLEVEIRVFDTTSSLHVNN